MKLLAKAINLVATETPIVSGTPAIFTLTKPNASRVSKTIMVDPNGQATAQFALGRNDQKGTYYGKVDLVILGIAISAETSVVVT